MNAFLRNSLVMSIVALLGFAVVTVLLGEYRAAVLCGAVALVGGVGLIAISRFSSNND
jgi:hypothetical protein